MARVRSFILAGAVAVISTAASAADMPPPPQIPYQPMIIEPVGSWYLRGDIGVGIQTFSAFNFTQTNPAFVWPSTWQIVQQNIQDTTIWGLGVGYEFNNWFRMDVTGEYRTKAAFRTTGSYTNFCGTAVCFDVNSGNYSAAVFMVNAYVDLGTWWCLTPYIGAGVGGAYNTISGMQDNGIIGSNGTVGFGYTANDNSVWDLAWNVQLGLTYNVNNNLKIDFNWRYLNLGSPVSAVVQCQNTASCPGAFYTFKDMTSQDFRIGFRWMLQPGAGVGVMAAAAPVLAPQPQFVPVPPQQYFPVQPQYLPPPQPPLQSRG